MKRSSGLIKILIFISCWPSAFAGKEIVEHFQNVSKSTKNSLVHYCQEHLPYQSVYVCGETLFKANDYGSNQGNGNHQYTELRYGIIKSWMKHYLKGSKKIKIVDFGSGQAYFPFRLSKELGNISEAIIVEDSSDNFFRPGPHKDFFNTLLNAERGCSQTKYTLFDRDPLKDFEGLKKLNKNSDITFLLLVLHYIPDFQKILQVALDNSKFVIVETPLPSETSEKGAREKVLNYIDSQLARSILERREITRFYQNEKSLILILKGKKT